MKSKYFHATCYYHGYYSHERDKLIRRAARQAHVRYETGSGFSIFDKVRDIGFKVSEDKRQIFATTVKKLAHCRVRFTEWKD